MKDSPQFDGNAFNPDVLASAELLALCERVCSEEITAQEFERLERLLTSDSAAREFYLNYLGLHGALSWDSNERLPTEHQSQAPSVAKESEAASPPLPPVLTAGSWPSGEEPIYGQSQASAGSLGLPSESGMFPVSPWAARLLGGGLAFVLLVVLLTVSALHRKSDRQIATTQHAVAVARLQSSSNCVWGGARSHRLEGEPLHSGERVELLQGSAKLKFVSGATVVVEAPSTFELATGKALWLDRGTVAVRADGPVKDFVVDSPDATIVDLGTSFGVHCDEASGTEVEVFEGAVEVQQRHDEKAKKRILGVGTSARIRSQKDPGRLGFEVVSLESNRFGNLLELLWKEIPLPTPDPDEEQAHGGVIEANFDDAPVPGTVDTFYSAVAGRGWLTPWVAAGNPQGEVVRDNPLSGEGNPYLRVGFYRSASRVIARSYGSRPDMDTTKPHKISWLWRFDGDLGQFEGDFNNQVHFYGNPYFRRRTWFTNSWLIGAVGAHETIGKLRQVHPMHWYAFDAGEVDRGIEFQRDNMIDSGIPLKAGVVYRFAVSVYPQDARYDVRIEGDGQAFHRAGLRYRNREAAPSNVLHFGLLVKDEDNPASFSLDSIRIEMLDEAAATWKPADEPKTEDTAGQAKNGDGLEVVW